MNIGVMGYYGYGNAGDDVILETLRGFLSPHNVIPIQTGFIADRETIRRLNGFDFLILGGGGLFNDSPTGPFNNFDQWENHLKIPIGVLGLGVKKINKEYVSAIHALVEHSRFFIVRDKESRELINLPKVQAAPDLTFYEPQCVGRQPIRSKEQLLCGINLRPTRNGTNEWIEAVHSLSCLKRAIPFSIVPAFDDRDPLRSIDKNCPRKFELEHYVGLDVLIGAAFHSVIFAVQNGIPSIAINYHPKVKRLMDELGLGDYVIDWNNPAGLKSLFLHLLDNYDIARDKMLEYTEQAHREIRNKLVPVREEIDATDRLAALAPHKKSSTLKVTVIINCQEEKTDKSSSQTIQSCLAQGLEDVDLILVTSPNNSDFDLPVFPELRRFKKIINNGETDWVESALKFVEGGYVLWLNAGEKLAQDGLSILVKSILENNGISLVYSDYYLTNEDIIERKVNPINNPMEAYLGSYGPCFLVVHKYALQLRMLQLQGRCSSKFRQADKVHVSHGLLFRQASMEEIYLYRSAISFGHGDVDAGRKYLEPVLQKLLKLRNRRAELEKLFYFFWQSPFEIIYYIDPNSFVENVCQNFPAQTFRTRRLANIFYARTAVAQAFQWQSQGNIQKSARFMLNAIKKDPFWLTNQGVLSIIMKSFFHVPSNHFCADPNSKKTS